MSLPIVAPERLWWTASEMAEAGLPDLPATQQSVERWIKRIDLRANPALARRRSGRGGGWEYHWSALPLAAQKALLAVGRAVPERARVVNRDEAWAQFEGLPQSAQDKARFPLGCVQAVEVLEGRLGRDLAVREAGEAQGVPARTLWSWLALIAGIRPDDRLPALAPRHRTAQRKLVEPAFDDAFFDWLKADYLRLAGPSFSSAYRRAERVAAGKGLAVAPERTMRRYLDARVSQPVQVLARKGVDALKRAYPCQTLQNSVARYRRATAATCPQDICLYRVSLFDHHI